MSFNSELLDEIAGLIGNEKIPRESLWLHVTQAMRGQTVYFPDTRRAWLRVAVRRLAKDKSNSIRGIARRLGAPFSTVRGILSGS